MRKILIILCLLALTGCSESENTQSIDSVSSNEAEKKEKKLEYDYDYMDGFVKDKSLYKDRMLGDYPNNVKSAENDPYTKDELRNLDYNKNIFNSLLNIRIPSKCQVFSKDGEDFVIDFPKSDDYEISIHLEKLFEDGELMEEEYKKKLMDVSAKKTGEKAKDKLSIIQAPVLIEADYKNIAYSIIEDNKYSYTNIFIATPINIVNFEIVENKEKSKASPYIMADLLSTAYIEGEDAPIVSKSFKDYEDYINIYATDKVDMGEFSFKIPSDMKKTQDSESLTVFEKRVSEKTIGQVLITKLDKKDGLSLKDAFNKSQGSNIPPAYLCPMGKVEEKIVDGRVFLRSKIRIYTEQFSLEGEKISFDAGDYYVSMILTGPLCNNTELLNSNIINSLKLSWKRNH